MPADPKSSPKQGFFIEVGCPGCGGEIEIDADFFVTKCSHCGSPLRLILPDTPPAYLIPGKLSKSEARFKIDRELKSLNLPLTGQSLVYKQIYYPYWKVDAMLLRLRNRKEAVTVQIDENSGEEVTDYKKNSQVSLAPYQFSIAASNHIDGVPDSLGVRVQTLRVVPYSDSKTEDEFDYLQVQRAPEEIVKTIELSLKKMNAVQLADFGQNLTKVFNPQTTLLFFPFCIAEDYTGSGYRRYVLDGMTGRILSRIDSEDSAEDSPKPIKRQSNILQLGKNLFEAFDNAASPLAGYDLVSDVGLRMDSAAASSSSEHPQIKFGAVKIAFHRCSNCGVDLPSRPSCIYICKNCHELTCLDKNISIKPKVFAASQPNPDSKFFPFWIFPTTTGRLLGFLSDNAAIAIPAFKFPNFEALYRLSKRVSTAAENIDKAEIDSLDDRFVPVDILPSEAMALANVVFYRHTLEKTNQLLQKELILLTDKLTLNYIPFKAEHYFFVDSVLNSVTFEKKLVKT